MEACVTGGRTTHRLLLLQLHTSEISRRNSTPIKAAMCVLAVVIVSSLTLTQYQCTDLGNSFIADFRYRLICESLIFARFLAAGMGSAYKRDSLYTRFWPQPTSLKRTALSKSDIQTIKNTPRRNGDAFACGSNMMKSGCSLLARLPFNSGISPPRYSR